MKAMSGHYGLYEVSRHSEEKTGPLRGTEGPLGQSEDFLGQLGALRGQQRALWDTNRASQAPGGTSFLKQTGGHLKGTLPP